MTGLELKLNQILTEKTTKIKPANIKNGVQIFDVEGTYEGEPPNLQSKTATITQNGTQTITADSGYDGLDEVEITTDVDDPLTTITSSYTTSTPYGGFAAYYIPSVNVKTTQAGCGRLFRSFQNVRKIKIEFGVAPTTVTSMFYDCFQLREIIIEGDIPLKATVMSFLFGSCNNLSNFPPIDTSIATDISGLFYSCKYGLTVAPTLDTSNAQDMSYMFQDCYSLITIPVYDTSSATNMKYMFQNCSALSNDSLNNILAMCANATNYTGTKTLKEIGLGSGKATTCTGLSNWSAAEAAGWTTGY